MESKRKIKKPNFTSTELDVLVSAIEASLHIINSTLTNTITNNIKKKTWSEITAKVNSVSTTTRTEDEIRKKWTDLKGQAKKAEATRRGRISLTGGGPPPEELSSLESKILQLIPQCLIEGIKGGRETPVTNFEVSQIQLSEPALACEAEPTPGCSKDSEEQEVFFTPLSPPTQIEDRDDLQSNTPANTKVRPSKKRSACETSTDSKLKEFSLAEEKKLRVFEDILSELRVLNSIQRERLNLEKEKFENEKSKDYSLSPIIRF